MLASERLDENLENEKVPERSRSKLYSVFGAFSDEQRASFNSYVASTRIRAARNIRGKPLPPGSTRESAAAVEGILKTTFEGLQGDLNRRMRGQWGETGRNLTAC